MHSLKFDAFLSILLQISILIGTIVILRNRPVFFYIVTQMLGITLEIILSTKLERDSVNNSSEGYFLNYYIIIALFLAYSFICLFRKENKFQINKPMMVFTILVLLSTLWARIFEFYDVKLVAILLMYFGAHNFVQNDYDIRLIMFSTLICGFIFSIFAIPNLINFSADSIYKMVSDTNYTGLFANTIIATGYSFLLIYDKMLSNLTKAFVIMLILLLSFAILLTASRTGLILFFLISFLYIYFNNQSKGVAFLSFGAIIAIIFYFFYEKLEIYFLFSYDRFFEDNINTLNSRTDIYNSYLNEFTDNSSIFEQFFGNGYYSTFSEHLAPHNNFIAILSFFGVIGLILFLWYIFFLVFKISKTKYKSLYLILIVFLFSGFTLESFNTPISVLMLSFLWSANRLSGVPKNNILITE